MRREEEGREGSGEDGTYTYTQSADPAHAASTPTTYACSGAVGQRPRAAAGARWMYAWDGLVGVGVGGGRLS